MLVPLLLVHVLGLWRIQAEKFRIEGFVDHVRFTPEGASRANKFHFTVYFYDGNWRNILEDLGVRDGKKQGVASWETAFDGTDHYKIVRLTNSTKPVDRTLSSYAEHGYVKTGELSTEESLTLNLLWLAFESGNYFANLKEPLMLSIFPAPPTNQLHFSIQSTLEGSGLPEHLSINFPGIFGVVRMVEPAGSERDREPHLVTNRVVYPAPFDRGYVAGDYQVLSKTNIDKWEVPLAVKFDYFVLRPTMPPKVERVLMERTSVVVTGLEVDRMPESVDVRPVFSSSQAHIYDYRFTNIAPQLGYPEKSKKWLDRKSADVEAVAKRIARASAQQNVPSPRAKWVTSFLMFFLLTPLVLLLSRKFRSKRKNNKTTYENKSMEPS